jgi:hypothetical protein
MQHDLIDECRRMVSPIRSRKRRASVRRRQHSDYQMTGGYVKARDCLILTYRGSMIYTFTFP